jgi:hypothetical protein
MDGYEAEYKETAETWRQLETKAQGTAAIAGILVAAAFAFSRDVTRFSGTEKIFLAVTVVLLVTVEILALVSLFIRSVDTRPGGTFLSKPLSDMLRARTEEDTEERYLAHLVDEENQWQRAILAHRNVNDRKANVLVVCHVTLIAATLSAGILAVVLLF